MDLARFCDAFMPVSYTHLQMFCGILAVNHQEKNGKIPKTLPIFLVAGKDDPVGNFGKSVENIYKNYKSCGIEDVSMKLSLIHIFCTPEEKIILLVSAGDQNKRRRIVIRLEKEMHCVGASLLVKNIVIWDLSCYD